jgi:CubicO group peptidase (beta-lactamase class C family)
VFVQEVGVLSTISRSTTSRRPCYAALARALAATALPILAATACSSTTGPADPSDIGSLIEHYEVPGVSVAVINDFELDYVEVHGVKSVTTQEPVAEGTLFQAASLSKGVSATAVMSLVQVGAVSLDTEINDYLTSWKLHDNAYQSNEKVTLRRLLSHTAGTTVGGFRGYRYTEPVPNLIQILNGFPPANSPPIVVDLVPGSEFRYSGGGYLVMQQAVQDVTGLAYTEFIRQRVLQPIGMSASTYDQPLPDSLFDRAASGYYADGVAVPGGHHIYPEIAPAALWTTSSDMARFVIEIQRSLGGESNRVLGQENAALLVTEVMRDYGLGFDLWTHRGQSYFGHYGANDGFRCRMVAHQSLGYGVVILTNSDNGHELADAVVRLIGEREGWPGY